MTTSSDDLPADFESLNRTFYQENGPGDFILMRLYALCIIGGSYDRFKDILADGVDFAKCQLRWTPVEDDEPNGLLEQSDEAFRQHFLRIETHHLKHLAIETLLRMFLGHRGFPVCPWYEISSFTDFRKFKDAVRRSLVEADQEDLQSAVLDVLLGRSGDLTTATDGNLDTSVNLSRFLRSFASDWLNEAKSYNATKHGLTAIPGAAHLRIGAEGGELVDIGYGDSLEHLSYRWEDKQRVWSVTTRWIRLEQAVGSIFIVGEMLKSLWSVARCRYGLSETYGTFRLPGSAFSIENLREMDTGSAKEMSRPVFVERRVTPEAWEKLQEVLERPAIAKPKIAALLAEDSVLDSG